MAPASAQVHTGANSRRPDPGLGASSRAPTQRETSRLPRTIDLDSNAPVPAYEPAPRQLERLERLQRLLEADDVPAYASLFEEAVSNEVIRMGAIGPDQIAERQRLMEGERLRAAAIEARQFAERATMLREAEEHSK